MQTIFVITTAISIFLTSCSAVAFTEKSHFPRVSLQANSIIKKYLDIHAKFRTQLCPPGTEPHYNSLVKDFRKGDHFLPLKLNNEVDISLLREHVHELEEKKRWLQKQIGIVKKRSDFKKEFKLIDQIDRLVDQLLKFKKQEFLGEKGSSEKNSAMTYLKLKKTYFALIKRIPFALNYGFPVDHLDLRKQYDSFKNSKNRSGKRRANKIYLHRKLVQDGTQNKKGLARDRFLRAAIDTIALEFKKNNTTYISENVRYDLRYIMRGLRKSLGRGKKVYLERLKDWDKRVEKEIAFDRSLISGQVESGGKTKTREELVNERSSARYRLSEFVLQKKRDTYLFWQKQSELMRALYVLETILVNEVSDLDGTYALDRRDVAKVVRNRTELPEYSHIEAEEEMHKALAKKSSDESITDFPWLNVMFKKGQFSFTYFFIKDNIRIYCPSMTKRGVSLRQKNLEIALELLGIEEEDFRAVRYFSRASMLGRIDMSVLWDSFTPMAERPGVRIGKPSKLRQIYRKGDYKHLYHFVGADGNSYQVIQIDDRNYVYLPAKKAFYTHRNPHYFRYFMDN